MRVRYGNTDLLEWSTEVTPEAHCSYGWPLYLRSYMDRADFIQAQQTLLALPNEIDLVLRSGDVQWPFPKRKQPTMNADRGTYWFADLRIYTDETTHREVREALIRENLHPPGAPTGPVI